MLLVFTQLDRMYMIFYTLSGSPLGSCSPLGKKYLLCLTLFVLMGSDVKTLMLECWLLDVHSLWIPSFQQPGLDKGQLTFPRTVQAAEVAKRNKPTQIHNSFTRVICQDIQYCLLGGNTSPAKALKALGNHRSGGGRLFTNHYYQARIAQACKDVHMKSASYLERNKNLRRTTV